jgi:hypothetical protein
VIRVHIDFRAMAAEAGLLEAYERAEDLRPVWLGVVQPLVTAFLTAQFATEGAAGGKKWAALAPVTHELRKRPGHGRGGIGRDTNRMWGSFVKSAGASAAPGGILVIDPLTYERGSAVPYARYFSRGFLSTRVPVFDPRHQAWRFIPRATPKRVPGRPVIPDPLPAELVEQVRAACARYIATGELL